MPQRENASMIDGQGAALEKRRTINPILKLVLELGPLALFFIAYSRLGLFGATGVMMVSVVVTLGVSYALLRRIPIMPLVTAIIVVIFGSLTFFFHDETFIKMKPTALYLLFGGALLGGLAFDRPLLPILFDGALNVTPEGWRKLTWRWAFFFVALALLNEIVWRTQTTSFWVGFKTFGIMPLTILFALAQAPLVVRYEAKDDERNEAL
ncbi:septation protein A [Methylocapsa sp. S129]|uniref:septation protein A n=1 Tax=Methylocapsa sp. S129 TaxID=1641869 RepID=UPI001FEF9DB4|nr:septation protein A [Methylocapsa sp. S129]